MNILQNPELLDHLASSYALGTLRGGARRRFETLAREQAPIRAAALIWQSRLASMNELQPQSVPDAAVWTRIDNLVQGEQQAKAMQAARESAPIAASGPTGWLRSLLSVAGRGGGRRGGDGLCGGHRLEPARSNGR